MIKYSLAKYTLPETALATDEGFLELILLEWPETEELPAEYNFLGDRRQEVRLVSGNKLGSEDI